MNCCTLITPQILVDINTREKESGVGGKGAEGVPWGGGKVAKKIQSERRRSADDWGGREDWHLNSENSCRISDRDELEEGEEEVLLWSNLAMDLPANLAGVFNAEGVEEAMKKAAAATIWRTEVMARCSSILRMALQDIIEGKVGFFWLGSSPITSHTCV